ncbi:acetylornithine aminotransferase ArgD [Gottschalkia purinilytica]|uniref:Acetylornithine aminotransferase n=1 Tax=Gottschalkia purinilytica TaxID=1503 RepID=A0A0L0WD65_GOTPU|nr:aspartate aminotransferase family protein [Gottschalkia purinilytica]KNF09381.1 acetylornithine aminotransferase ArgD [Gottschalkia purinilytica]
MDKEWIDTGKKFIMNTYSSFPIVLEKGEGCYVYDKEGKRYLDFVSGIAVNSLGYSNEDFVNALNEQLKKIHHCSNLYWSEPTITLAKLLVENSAFDKVFFCNSGTESVEAGLKLSRKYGNLKRGEECYEIITMKNSFHGRTFGSITATGQEKYQNGFGPLLPGVKYAPYNDFETLKSMVNKNTCAIVVEAIQGEGGICPAEKEYLKNIRKLCDELDIVLIFDEVQSGIGRTGKLFAYEIYNIEPDIICLAKGLGGGFPIGAMMAVEKIANVFEPGNHASTFGGNPLACTAGITVLNKLLNEGVLQNVEKQGEYLKKKLLSLKEKVSFIKDVRGYGLMQGIEIEETSPSDIINKCIEKGLLLVGAGANVIRFVPPLTIKEKEIDEAVEILGEVLSLVK